MCAVFTWIEGDTLHIVVANVGDSRAYVAWVDKTDNLSSKKQPETQILNDLHDLEHEKNRIPPENIKKDKFGRKRLNRRLNMGRSLGDSDLLEHGLSPQPDIYHHQFSLVNRSDSQPIIIVASDGIAPLDTAAISQTILGSAKEDDISKKLAKKAETAWKKKGYQVITFLSLLFLLLMPQFNLLSFVMVMGSWAAGSRDGLLRSSIKIST